MKTVILCGGKGTRIRDVSDSIPKPMIPIGSQPVLWHIMKHYARYGHTDFVLCLGYKGTTIKEFFLNYEALTNNFTITLGKADEIQYDHGHDESGWSVTLADTGLDSLTGTRIAKIADYLGDDENFMLTYGDGLGPVDLDALVDFHNSHGKLMTLTGVRPPGRFGEVNFDKNGMVMEFNEKPQANAGWISGGFFICRKEVLKYLDVERNEMLEESPLRNLVKDNQLMVYQHTDFWQCMDTYRDYKMLNQLWDQGNAPWKTW